MPPALAGRVFTTSATQEAVTCPGPALIMGEKKNSSLCILGSFGYSNLTFFQLKQKFAVKIRCSFDKKNKTKTKWPWLSSWEWDFPCSSVGKESACNAEGPGLIPGLGRSPGEGNGDPLQYSCLENPMDCSLPGSSVHGILQASILEWPAILSSRGSSRSRKWTQISCITGRFFTNWATGEAPFKHQAILN